MSAVNEPMNGGRFFPHQSKRRKSLVLRVASLLLLAAFPLPAESQSTQNVPVVEPRFTRILGTDSMRINGGGIINARSVAVSPNGRWIAWEGDTQIWVAPTTGGDPVQVGISSHDHNSNPVWFPNSRQLAFRSGSASLGPFIYSVDLDPRTGHPQLPPRQVSIEPQNMYGFGVSPDGSQVVYVRAENGRFLLRVVPSRGGTAHTLWEGDEDRIWWPVWSPDGGSIFVLTHQAGYNGGIRRIPSGGGTGEMIGQWTEGLPQSLSPDGRYVLRTAVSPSGEPIWEIATIEGRSLARFHLPENMAPTGFWPGEPTILAVASETAAPLWVVPIGGGPARQLTETRAYDNPLRWMPDGRQLFMQTQLDGETVYMLMDVESGSTRQIQLPEPVWRESTPPAISGNGRYVGWVTGRLDEEIPVVKLLDVENGTVHQVTDSPCRLNRLWPMWDGGRFLYCEERGSRQEYRALTPGEASEILIEYPADVETFPGIGVRGDRVAFTENDGDEGAIFLTGPGTDEPRRLVALPGAIGKPGFQPPVFAPDGRTIVVGHTRPDGAGLKALVVRLTAEGGVSGDPLILELEGGPLWWGGPQWLPDGRGFVIQDLLDRRIWLVHLDPATEPVELTSGIPDNNLSWGFSLSPDGRQIAYSLVRPGGSSIWKVELGDSIRH
jgi:Tol biopolymer transport system component